MTLNAAAVDSSEDDTPVGVDPDRLRAVVALAGARDRFQVPLALSERGMLSTLITDLFWPTRSQTANHCLQKVFGTKRLAKRSCDGIDSAAVRIPMSALAAFAGMAVARHAHVLNIHKGSSIGAMARRVALQSGSAVISYAGCAFEAFREGSSRPEHRILFAMQADPRSRRALLLDEIDRLPAAKDTLLQEYEFRLSHRHFDELASEPHCATGILANSRYTASTLIRYGISADRIHVVPYGVSTEMFSPRQRPPSPAAPFRVAYVGRLTQGKGLADLLQAVRLLRTQSIVVDVYTGTLAGDELLRAYSDVNVRTSLGLSGRELGRALQTADVLALPSLSEGFGHVILEGMACGLPVIATPHTCAPDVVIEDVHGFIVPIRDARAIATRLEWAINNRADLADMGAAAAQRAAHFTWDRFRKGVAKAYLDMRFDGRHRAGVL